MVSKRRQPAKEMTEHERFLAMLESLPVSDEDPAVFWGPDWRERLEESIRQVEAGECTFYESDEAFLRSLAEDFGDDANVCSHR